MMNNQRGWISIVFFMVIGLGARIAVALNETTELPRYRLVVGQELNYKGESEFKYEGGQFVTRDEWTFWVVRKKPDDSWRIIVRQARTFTQVRENQEPDENERKPEWKLGWFNLYPDGRIPDNPTLSYHINPSSVLPQLPHTQEELTTGWQATQDFHGVITRYQVQPDTENFVFKSESESAFKVIYGMEENSVLTFDVRRGLLEKVERQNRQTYGFKGEGTDTIKLVDVRERSPEWCQQLLVDSERYFSSLATFQAAVKNKELKPNELKAELLRRNEELKKVADTVPTEELQPLMASQSERRERELKYDVEEAEKRQELLGTPSHEWETTDLDGKEHALKNYRGRVVIMDFWYRGCGWCIKAMPQMKEIANYFADRPVTVFGMNTDEKDEDALFVVEKLGLNYDNLKGKELSEKYQVQEFGFPTLIILDQEGVLRDIHVGYSPHLKDDVIESVERLLKAAP